MVCSSNSVAVASHMELDKMLLLVVPSVVKILRLKTKANAKRCWNGGTRPKGLCRRKCPGWRLRKFYRRWIYQQLETENK